MYFHSAELDKFVTKKLYFKEKKNKDTLVYTTVCMMKIAVNGKEQKECQPLGTAAFDSPIVSQINIVSYSPNQKCDTDS